MNTIKSEPSFITLLLMISFAAANAVLITPALPDIASYFSISTETTQLIVVWFLVGYALGQLIYGPLANRYGRKPALYIGISLQIISSLICILSGVLNDFNLMVIGRFTLALGAGVGLKMAFTILNECYEPKIVSQKVSYLMLAFAISPGISMAIGGYLTARFGWMSCYYAGAAYGLILLPLLTRLPETLKVVDKNALKFKYLLKAYKVQFKNVRLFAGGLMMGLTTCFIYVFSAIAPFVAISILGMSSETYGAANIIPSVGYMLGAVVSENLAKKYDLKVILRSGIGVVGFGVLTMSLGAFFELPAMLALFVPITIIYFGEALIYPNASVIAMSSAIDKAHASSVMKFLTIGLPTLAVLSFGKFTITTLLLPMIFGFLLFAIIIVYRWIMSVKEPGIDNVTVHDKAAE